MSRPVRLRSPLDPIAAALRLKAAMERKPPDDAATWVVGSGSEAEMTLRHARRGVVNSFALVLRATMAPDGGGTLIEGRIGMARGTRLFCILWFGFLTLFLLASVPILAVFATVSQGAPAALMAIPMMGGIPLLMMAFGALLIWSGRRKSRDDDAAILAFLAREIEARPLSDAVPPAAPRTP